MYIQQIYTNCLAQASYYIESKGEAAIIDPLRDVDMYIELARTRNARIRYVLETHFHADFVSGHLDLAERTGAIIVFGPGAKPSYAALIAKHGERLYIGDVMIEVLHTPGHTIESACYLVVEDNVQKALFSGDTLFIGDVGRPDLMSGNLSAEELASKLYDSLNNHIKTLPDSVIVYPGHGAGSACGKNLSKETVSTIGEQKKYNYALQPMSREEFIRQVTSDQPAPPPYFFKDAMINITGYESFSELMKRNMNPFSPAAFEAEMKKGAIVLDTRSASEFAADHIPGAINIGLEGDFAVWAGTIIEFNTPLLLVTRRGQEEESVRRLARVGYDNVKGYLEGGMAAWITSGKVISDIPSMEYRSVIHELEGSDKIILDARRKAELANGKVEGSLNIPLNELKNRMNELDNAKPIVVYCAGGYRSMIAASMLRAAGFTKVYNVIGGYSRIKQDAMAAV